MELHTYVKLRDELDCPLGVLERLSDIEKDIKTYYYPQVDIICDPKGITIALDKYYTKEWMKIPLEQPLDPEVCAQFVKEILRDENYLLQSTHKSERRYVATVRLKKRRAKLTQTAKELHDYWKEAQKELKKK